MNSHTLANRLCRITFSFFLLQDLWAPLSTHFVHPKLRLSPRKASILLPVPHHRRTFCSFFTCALYFLGWIQGLQTFGFNTESRPMGGYIHAPRSLEEHQQHYINERLALGNTLYKARAYSLNSLKEHIAYYRQRSFAQEMGSNHHVHSFLLPLYVSPAQKAYCVYLSLSSTSN
ncbi:hypothetical protein DFH09DRAFT_1100262 [Mycena vulgaris]|nr:hypothetical protein DFH09DRAFT_1100262 [Mycena vulgaris]